MNKENQVLAWIDNVRGVIFTFLTALLGLFGWMAVNFDSLDPKLKGYCFGAIVAIIVVLSILVALMITLIKKLEYV